MIERMTLDMESANENSSETTDLPDGEIRESKMYYERTFMCNNPDCVNKGKPTTVKILKNKVAGYEQARSILCRTVQCGFCENRVDENKLKQIKERMTGDQITRSNNSGNSK